MLRLYFTVCVCSATICARKSTFGVLILFTHLGNIILLFFVSWVDNSCVHSLEKSMDDLKQTVIASREARLCRYREMPESGNISLDTKPSTRNSKN